MGSQDSAEHVGKPRRRDWRSRVDDLLQLRFPKEFRIAAPPWPPEIIDAVLDRLSAALTSNTIIRVAPAARGKDRGKDDDRALGRFIADVATNLWRLQQKMVDDSGQPREETRRLYRHVESMSDAFRQQGVEIKDHTGEATPEGGSQQLKILACQPTPGINRDRIIETVKPSVVWRGGLVQMGEVIVGVPDLPSPLKGEG